MMMRLANVKYAALCCCFLALAACSKKTQPTLDTPGLNTGLNDGGGQSAPGSKGDFKTNVGDRVYFLNDQTNLSPEAADTLTKQASWLKQYRQVTIQVEGHADERGTREYNISLSARRATTVRPERENSPCGRSAPDRPLQGRCSVPASPRGGSRP